MKFELELENYNTMQYKTKAIADVLGRTLGGSWKVKEIPFTPVKNDIPSQVDAVVKQVLAGKSL